MIEKILEDKRQQLIKSGGLKRATFNKEEIDHLMNLNELRVFKIAHPMPSNFQFCTSVEESVQKVLSDGSDYAVLEYCAITQPVLQISIGKVFKNWRFFNGLHAVR